ncbi:MAG: hypothetical protein K8R67_15740 [Desulfobacteraceae bacterium]|nr:hypothetical protein [Desulfobacteraceae bacterium]
MSCTTDLDIIINKQKNIAANVNLTYKESLRHIVRQDPDVIGIAEIEIGIKAAQAKFKTLL